MRRTGRAARGNRADPRVTDHHAFAIPSRRHDASALRLRPRTRARHGVRRLGAGGGAVRAGAAARRGDRGRARRRPRLRQRDLGGGGCSPAATRCSASTRRLRCWRWRDRVRPAPGSSRARCTTSGLPPCAAITAHRRGVNYGGPPSLELLFRRVHAALEPDGLLVFDAAAPGREPELRRRARHEGDGWDDGRGRARGPRRAHADPADRARARRAQQRGGPRAAALRARRGRRVAGGGGLRRHLPSRPTAPRGGCRACTSTSRRAGSGSTA